MSTSQKNLKGLSFFVFKTPSWKITSTFSLCIAALAGVAGFESAFVLEDAWRGVFFMGLPTLLAAAVTPALDRFAGGSVKSDQSFLLALLGEMIVVCVVAVAAAAAYLPSMGEKFVVEALAVSLSMVLAFRLVIFMAVRRRPIRKALVPASAQTVSAAVFLTVYSGALSLFLEGSQFGAFLDRSSSAPPELVLAGPEHLLLLVLSSTVFTVAVKFFLDVIDIPWKRTFGVSILDFLEGFIGHMNEEDEKLEQFFSRIGETRTVPVHVVSFKGENGEKARFVAPRIHPGPLGEVGGSNVPERIASSCSTNVFVPHGTAGHDYNLVNESEVERVVEASKEVHETLEYGRDVSGPERTHGELCSVTGLSIGESKLMVASFAPNSADDIEVGAGAVAQEAARTNGEESLLLDAHSSLGETDGESLFLIKPGSRAAEDLRESCADLGEMLEGSEERGLEMGVSSKATEWGPMDGIGPLGIRVAAFETGRSFAYVLIDGNNMVTGLRDSIRDRLLEEGFDDAEVSTTDTHRVNTFEAENRVGESLDGEKLIEQVVDAAAEARKDRETVSVGMGSKRVQVKVFGEDRTEMLASHANAMVSIGAGLAGAVTLLALVFCGLIWALA